MTTTVIFCHVLRLIILFIVSFYSLFVNDCFVWSVLFFKLRDQLYWEWLWKCSYWLALPLLLLKKLRGSLGLGFVLNVDFLAWEFIWFGRFKFRHPSCLSHRLAGVLICHWILCFSTEDMTNFLWLPGIVFLVPFSRRRKAFPGSLLCTRVSVLVLCLLWTWGWVSYLPFRHYSSLVGPWAMTLLAPYLMFWVWVPSFQHLRNFNVSLYLTFLCALEGGPHLASVTLQPL